MKSNLVHPEEIILAEHRNNLRFDARLSSYLQVRENKPQDMSVIIDEGVFTQ